MASSQGDVRSSPMAHRPTADLCLISFFAQSCGRIGEYIVNELQHGVVHREGISRRRTRRDARSGCTKTYRWPHNVGTRGGGGVAECRTSALVRKHWYSPPKRLG